MMHSNNTVIIAAAGSGKTTFIVDQAICKQNQRVLLLTYTQENLNEIKKSIIKRLGFVPSHITVQSWFSFLLHNCARPYQNFLYDKRRIESIKFVEGRSTNYVKQSEIERYYFSKGRLIYTDKISQFAWTCNDKSGGLVISRLERMYDYIFIDEVQDLGGWDLEVINLFFRSSIHTVLVGDNRQTTYKTNNAAKNSKYSRDKILVFFLEYQKRKLCSIEYRTECHRSNQEICNFADSLYPLMPKTISKNDERTGHDGVFTVKLTDTSHYMEKYNPVVLRYNISSKCPDAKVIMNYGQSKGLTFDRVLIIPTGPIKKYLIKGSDIPEESKSKFYVAVTRARYSVAFLMNEKATLDGVRQYSCISSS